MRVYMHYEEEDPNHTAVLTSTGPDTLLDDLLCDFLRSYVEHYGEGAADLDAAVLELRSSKQKKLKRAGKVFGILRVMSLQPEVLRPSMALYAATTTHPDSPLPRWFRELVAVEVSDICRPIDLIKKRCFRSFAHALSPDSARLAGVTHWLPLNSSH